jgi:hypothetical protein
LRETYREGGKIKKRTLLNLTSWPAEQVEGLRIILKGGTALPPENGPSPLHGRCLTAMWPPFSARSGILASITSLVPKTTGPANLSWR